MLEYVDRRGTGCEKWDGQEKTFGEGGLLGMWVADMDFKTAPCVRQALAKLVDEGVFGYNIPPEGYYTAFADWQWERHGYAVDRKWLRFTPGVVTGLNLLVQMLTEVQDAVIILSPVYYPFANAVRNNDRRLIECDLVNDGGAYSVDFEKFERDIVENDVRAFILCSPHNPVGRVWTGEELRRMLDICKAHDVKVIADEIHNDFVFEPYTHHCAATVGSYDDILVTLMAPSKTFNLAGCQNAFVIIPDEGLRQQFDALQKTLAMTNGSMFGYVAAEAAYRGGAAWFDELKQTVWENYTFARDYLAEQLPQAVVTELQGTYLMWIDLGAYLAPAEMEDFFQHRCRLAVDYGHWFGKTAQTMIRLNLATSQENVQTAVRNITKELKAMGRA